VILALLLPTWPAPTASVLLAQAATALAALEHAETEARGSAGDTVRLDQLPIWDWASRNLSAASARLLSPADRFELAVGPWSTYVVLPLFAFSAVGVPLSLNLAHAGSFAVLSGVVLGLVLGKPVGVLIASWLAVKTGVGAAPDGVTPTQFIGAAFLCGVGDTVALLMADRAFPTGGLAATAKIGVLVGSLVAGGVGTFILILGSRAAATQSPAAPPSLPPAEGQRSPSR
jgi:NhaA family Na+:H+ antiporter